MGKLVAKLIIGKRLVPLILLTALGFGTTSSASYDKNVFMTGVLKKYDAEFVWLEVPGQAEYKKLVKFNRKRFSSLQGYVVGVATLRVEAPLVELIEMNPDIFKK